MKQVDPLAALKAHRDRFETLAAAAADLGISFQYYSDLLNGRRDPDAPRLLAKLGLKRIVVAERKTA